MERVTVNLIVILFLGAGASRPFGIPTMPEFIEIFDKAMKKNRLYNELKNGFGKESFDLEVLMTILEDMSKDTKELFRTISPQTSAFLLNKMDEGGFTLHDLLPNTNTAKKLLSELKGIIRKECFKAVQNNANEILSVYDELFGYLRGIIGTEVGARVMPGFHRAGDGRLEYPRYLKVFTTNYDTCIETFLHRHQVVFAQGIAPRYGYNVFDVDSFIEKEGSVEVFKLHGSVDLFRKNGEIRQLPAYTSDGLTFLGEEFGEELMRYPTEFGGYRHVIESPYLELFRLFRDRLKSDFQSLWLLIGSSFRDVTICSIMNDVLRLGERGRNPLIILVNPNARMIIDRLKEWGMNTFASLIEEVDERFGTHECITGLSRIFEPLMEQ